MVVRARIVSGTAMEIGEHGRPQVRSDEPARRREALEHGEPRRRTFRLGHRDRAVQRVQTETPKRPWTASTIAVTAAGSSIWG